MHRLLHYPLGYLAAMGDPTKPSDVRKRLASKGEDALGKLASELLENPLINSALTRALDARERAAQAQEVAMGALNIPSASDIERLTRRLRSVSQRLEGIEDGIERLEHSLGAGGMEQRLAEIERKLATPAAAAPAAPKAKPKTPRTKSTSG